MATRTVARKPYKKRAYNKRTQYNKSAFARRVKAIVGKTQETKSAVENLAVSGQLPLSLSVTETLSNTAWAMFDFSPCITQGDTARQREGTKAYLKSIDFRVNFQGGASYPTVRMIVVKFKEDPVSTWLTHPLEMLYRTQNTDPPDNFGLNTPISNYQYIKKVIMDKVFNLSVWNELNNQYNRHVKLHIKCNHVITFNDLERANGRTTGPYFYYCFILPVSRVPAGAYILMIRSMKWTFKEY